MEDDAKTLKGELVRGLKNYFDGDIEKVKSFGAQLKTLGFDLDDLETLKLLKNRSEALIVLLGLSDFGALESVTKSIEHLRGRGNPSDFTNQYVSIFSK